MKSNSSIHLAPCCPSIRPITHHFLDLAAYILIPVLTISFVKGSNWFTTNFSVLGNGLQRKNAFVFWGLFVGIYFFIILQIICRFLLPPPRELFLIPLSLLLLTCAITTPYLPEQFPLKSFFHVAFAFLSAVCLSSQLVLLTWKLSRLSPDNFHLYLVGLFLILLCSASLLLAAGIVSSALEIFFTLSAALFCRRLERKLNRIFVISKIQ